MGTFDNASGHALHEEEGAIGCEVCMEPVDDCECPECPTCHEHGNPDCRTDKCGGLVGYMTNGEYIKKLFRLSSIGPGTGNTFVDFAALLAEVELLPVRRRNAIMTAVALKQETSR